MIRSIVVGLVALAAAAPAPPSLQLVFLDRSDGALIFPGHEWVQLRVVYHTERLPRLEDGSNPRPLQIDAENRSPDHEWPDPTVELTVTPADDPDAEALPIRVTSSGGGSEVVSEGALYKLWVDFQVLAPEEERISEAVEYVRWLRARTREVAPQVLSDLRPGDLEKIAENTDRQYTRTPPGTYRLTARYTPGAEDPNGSALETSVTFEVTQGRTLIDQMKELEAARQP